MLNKTPLYEKHLESKAKIVDFHGWLMPIHYGSQIEEHQAVRKGVGIFDVSHMMAAEISGPDRKAFLSYMLANDVAKLAQKGQAFYSLMLNEKGGIIDDLIVYHCDSFYRLITNGGTREKVSSWLMQHAESFDVDVQFRNRQVMLAVQGPDWYEQLSKVVEPGCAQKLSTLKRFHGVDWQNWYLANTGYTGEQGVELLLPEEEGVALWDRLVELGVQPCGLGARDTLRLEAGLNLYGLDMDETILPAEANLNWTVSLEAVGSEKAQPTRSFIGREALEEVDVEEELIGLVVNGRGIPRSGQVVTPVGGETDQLEKKAGKVTSGSFSPTLGMGIAFARVPKPSGSDYQVQIRNKSVVAQAVSLPFVKAGKKAFAVRG